MSFIYNDQDLINKLISIGLKKNAQGVLPPPMTQEQSEEQSDSTNNLLKLITSLQHQLSGSDKRDPRTAPTISHEGDVTKKPSINSTNLESLGDLLRFLTSSKIILDGKRVAYTSFETPPDGSYVRHSLETHTYGVGTRAYSGQSFFVNPELLKLYITYLQPYAAKNPGMQAQLKGIIGEINNAKDLNVNIGEKQEQSVMQDNQLLDTVPKNFDGSQADLGSGQVQILYKSVKDAYAFRVWLQDNEISMSKDGQKFNYNSPNFNKCFVLNSLSLRADYMYGKSTTQEQANIVAEYKKRVLAIMGQEKCSVTGGNSQQQNQQGNPGVQNAEMLVSQIVSRPPLSMSDVDFGRIKNFFDDMVKLMGNVQIIPQLKAESERYMSGVAELMRNAGETSFQFGMSRADFANMLKNEKEFNNAIKYLNGIVNAVWRALAALRNQYSRDGNVIKFVGEQIGIGNDPSSAILGSNRRSFDAWYRQTR